MAFFAIMNPIINIPIFVQLMEGLEEKKRKFLKQPTLLHF